MTETVAMMIESVYDIVGDEAQAKKIVRNILDAVGGVQLYLPRPDAAFREDRDKEIFDRFNGKNMNEICREFDISFKAVYQAVHRYQKRAQQSKGKKPAVPGELFEM